MDNQQTSLFREAALKQFSSPEQLDQLIQVVSPRSWLIAIVIYALLLMFIFWLIFGSVSTTVEGPGIILAGGGDIYSASVVDGPSRVDQLLVKPGDIVKKDQPLAILSRPDIAKQLIVAEAALADLTDKYNDLATTAQQEVAARQQQNAEKRQLLQKSLADNQDKLNNIETLLKIKQAAFAKGIEIRQNVTETQQQVYAIKQQSNDYANSIEQLNIDANNFEDQWHERLRDLQLKIADQKNALAKLQAQQTLSSAVLSPVDGTVTSLQAKMGGILNTGDSVVNIASGGNGLDVLAYLPPQLGKRVKIGMETLVNPTIVEKAEYGSIYGKVVDISPFPVTAQSLQAKLQNSVLVQQFSGKGAPIEVRVHLQNNSATFSGLKWTSSRGPRLQITPGTQANTRIIVLKQRPITLVLPALKKITGTT